MLDESVVMAAQVARLSPGQLIASDLYRFCGKADFRTGARYFPRSAPFRYQVWLRLRRSGNPLVRFVARVMHGGMSRKYGVEIPPMVEFGYGLMIPHLLSIVVNSTANFGNNCTLNHGVTVGSVRSKSAVVGNDVYIGPQSCLVEDITVGDGATIGAGAIVVKDVAAGTTVAGNPAVVVSTKAPGRLIKNRWTPAR